MFDGTGSSDPDGVIVAYDWDFGDGNIGSGPNPSHTYAADGIYTVSLAVADDAGDDIGWQLDFLGPTGHEVAKQVADA